MRTLEEVVKSYYATSLSKFIYTSPISGIATIIAKNRCYNQSIYTHDGKVYFGYIELVRRNDNEN